MSIRMRENIKVFRGVFGELNVFLEKGRVARSPDVQSRSVLAKWRCRPREGGRRWLGKSAFFGVSYKKGMVASL